MVQGGIKTTIFELTGNKGNKWSPYEVNLPAGGPYKVVIINITFFIHVMMKQLCELTLLGIIISTWVQAIQLRLSKSA